MPLEQLFPVFTGFSNVSVSQKQKTLEKPTKAIKTMIFKSSRPDGRLAPADRLQMMAPTLCVSSYWFFHCFGRRVCHFL